MNFAAERGTHTVEEWACNTYRKKMKLRLASPAGSLVLGPLSPLAHLGGLQDLEKHTESWAVVLLARLVKFGDIAHPLVYRNRFVNVVAQRRRPEPLYLSACCPVL